MRAKRIQTVIAELKSRHSAYARQARRAKLLRQRKLYLHLVNKMAAIEDDIVELENQLVDFEGPFIPINTKPPNLIR